MLRFLGLYRTNKELEHDAYLLNIQRKIKRLINESIRHQAGGVRSLGLEFSEKELKNIINEACIKFALIIKDNLTNSQETTTLKKIFEHPSTIQEAVNNKVTSFFQEKINHLIARNKAKEETARLAQKEKKAKQASQQKGLSSLLSLASITTPIPPNTTRSPKSSTSSVTAQLSPEKKTCRSLAAANAAPFVELKCLNPIKILVQPPSAIRMHRASSAESSAPRLSIDTEGEEISEATTRTASELDRDSGSIRSMRSASMSISTSTSAASSFLSPPPPALGGSLSSHLGSPLPSFSLINQPFTTLSRKDEDDRSPSVGGSPPSTQQGISVSPRPFSDS